MCSWAEHHRCLFWLTELVLRTTFYILYLFILFSFIQHDNDTSKFCVYHQIPYIPSFTIYAENISILCVYAENLKGYFDYTGLNEWRSINEWGTSWCKRQKHGIQQAWCKQTQGERKVKYFFFVCLIAWLDFLMNEKSIKLVSQHFSLVCFQSFFRQKLNCKANEWVEMSALICSLGHILLWLSVIYCSQACVSLVEEFWKFTCLTWMLTAAFSYDCILIYVVCV